MVTVGAHCEGFLECPLTKLDNGYVVPDVSLSELHEYQRRAVETQVELAVAAESLGYDFVVHAENHFELLSETAPDPVLSQTAIAVQTEEIRLLQAANSLPRRDPIRLAEQTAMLDVLSDGRVDVGVATGGGSRETAVFEPSAETEVLFEEYTEILRRAWGDDPLQFDGETYTVPPEGLEWDHDQEYSYYTREGSGCHPETFVSADGDRNVLSGLSTVPRPKQRPRPQLWRATASPEGAAQDARAGMNVCTFATTFERLADIVDAYHEAAETAGWPDRRSEYDGDPFDRGWDADRRRGVVAQIQLFDTDAGSDEAVAKWKRGQECLLSARRSNRPPEEAKRIPIDADKRIAATDVPIVAGTDEIVSELRKLRDLCGYEDFALIPSIPLPGVPKSERLHQYESFAEKVVPRLDG